MIRLAHMIQSFLIDKVNHHMVFFCFTKDRLDLGICRPLYHKQSLYGLISPQRLKYGVLSLQLKTVTIRLFSWFHLYPPIYALYHTTKLS